ncbi:MAG: glycosyltransferase, partial [Acidimicrobiia bacterium]|nr:glycosyltransferase [Acidimicrobiia bacterium]
LERCLAQLAKVADQATEVIIVGNAVDPGRYVSVLEAAGLAGRILALAVNRGPSPARNAAARAAAAPLLLFLDDDAMPEPGWVDAHRAAHQPAEVQAVRGRVRADRSPFLTRLARAYDLGDEPRRAVLNTEGNASVKTAAFQAVGGFAPMFGHEGIELSGRLIQRYGPDSIVYSPGAIIRHDYVTSFGGFLRKRFRHGRMMRHLGLGQIRTAAAVRPPWRWSEVALAPMHLLGVGAELLGLMWPGGDRMHDG